MDQKQILYNELYYLRDQINKVEEQICIIESKPNIEKCAKLWTKYLIENDFYEESVNVFINKLTTKISRGPRVTHFTVGDDKYYGPHHWSVMSFQTIEDNDEYVDILLAKSSDNNDWRVYAMDAPYVYIPNFLAHGVKKFEYPETLPTIHKDLSKYFGKENLTPDDFIACDKLGLAFHDKDLALNFDYFKMLKIPNWAVILSLTDLYNDEYIIDFLDSDEEELV